jgi:hypothetical protein
LTQPARRGIGAALRAVVHYGRSHGYDVMVVMAGNNKDDPAEIPRQLVPILDQGVDYVQGSRFLPGGSSPHLPRASSCSSKPSSVRVVWLTVKPIFSPR